MITKDLFDQIVAVLLPEMGDANTRKALIESALYGSLLLQKIQWDGPARPFTVRLVRELDQFGEIEPGKPALVALLEEIKPQVGANRQTEIDSLLTQLKSPPATQEIQPPPKTFMAAVNAVYGEIEIGLHQAQPEAIQVELRVTDPGLQGEIAPARGEARISPGKLLEELLVLQIHPTQYGEALANYIFQDRNVRELFSNTKAAFERSGLMLRLRLLIGPSVSQLHGLRWELLCDPLTLKPLATSERILFSRFMHSQDWRVIKLRPKAELKALLAVSAPSNLADYRMADVDKQGEIARARESLTGIQATVVGQNESLTLVLLMEAIRQGVDVLYLVCHGGLSNDLTPYLCLQGEDGKIAMTPASDFAQRVSDLPETPRLIVLASCESAGREDGGFGENGIFAAQTALARRLAEAGVPAVIAMQGKISMETVKLAMPVFFRELLKDGQIDRAMAVARGTVRERHDSWMPALFTRLKSGRIWDEPGFAAESKEEFQKRSIQLEPILDDLKRDFVLTPPAKRGEKDSVVEVLEKDSEQDVLTKYRRERIAEWSQPRYALEKRFVNLTLLIDKGEQELERWQRDENFRFDDLRDVLARTLDDRALVLLGAPGSGKSTLLRRLQLDHSEDRLRDGADEISFFIPLNNYNGEQLPREWLLSSWRERDPNLPPLENWLRQGRALLLLDALNEMQPRAGLTYDLLLGRWREFVQQAERLGNRLVFSCRKLDYSAGLSSKDLPVPQVQVQPLNDQQVREFLRAYAPAQEHRIWAELEKDARQLELFKTPYFLKLLCEQVGTAGALPKGRAGLFTGFVRKMLARASDGPLFQRGALLDERDRRKLSLRDWSDSFALPERGLLIPQLSALAFSMQHKRSANENAQLRLSFDDACALLAQPHAEDLLKAGQALSVLDEDTAKDEILFFHQLLQEYFAARRLAKEPKPELVHVEWEAEKVQSSLEETLAGLADGDPLPPLAQTGWEETTLTAAPMAKDSLAFIRDLIPENLPLAARCAASPEVNISAELKREIQHALIARTQDMKADLRARIAAGEALGTMGDPRFERRKGLHGEYLLPPLVEIPGGTYPIGDGKSDYSFEKPARKVELERFQIGKFPVTNAEYKLFIDAGGYEEEHWWETSEALAWLREGGAESSKQSWRDHRKLIQSWSEDDLRDLVKQNRATSLQVEEWIEIRNWTNEEFEKWLEETFPSGKLYRQPEFWDDTRFNNPAQPVVGVTWFEARAYCNWLTATAGEEKIYRLPTEVEFEAAARGKKGRMFPYGKAFEVSRGNTFESHIRRTAPVGIFDNATPEGALDLSGNAYTWTLSIYDQDKFPYPYRSDDGREDIHQTGVKRVLRGGAWINFRDFARAVYRDDDFPDSRDFNLGFRVVGVIRPPSQ